MLDHARLMGRRLAERARRKIDDEHIETQLAIVGKQRHYAHVGVVLIVDRQIAVAVQRRLLLRGRRLKKAENATLKPVAIFHSVATVGLDSPRSICPSIALLTPVYSAACVRLQPRCARSVRRCAPNGRQVPASCSPLHVGLDYTHLCAIAHDAMLLSCRAL